MAPFKNKFMKYYQFLHAFKVWMFRCCKVNLQCNVYVDDIRIIHILYPNSSDAN